MATWRIVSWNVNGLRSCEKKGFLDWLHEEKHTVVGLQEVRAQVHELSPALVTPKGYSTHIISGKKKGYSGVGTYSREAPLSVDKELGKSRFDDEARMLGTEYPEFLVYNVYFPKGSGTERDNSRVPYKLDFYDAMVSHAIKRSKKLKKPLIIMGDFNTAHQPIDLKNPKTNTKTSGFLPEEREDFARHLGRGFVDTFRHLHPNKVQYSWWSARFGVREKNVGWRIDYVWMSKELLPHLKEAFIHDHVKGSDHCPVGITLKL